MPAAKFCAIPNCFEVAVREVRSSNHCRDHYRSNVIPDVEMVYFEVTAPATPKGKRPGVVDSRTGETVYFGGMAELDPLGVKITELVAAGLGRVVPTPLPVED